MSAPEQKAVFIDRDDTILVDEGYMSDPAQVRLVPGAAQALGRLRRANYLLVLVSNQSGVGRGWITRDQVRAIQDRMCALLPGIDFAGFQYCFHRPDQGCGCRKPEPTLILQAAERLLIDLPCSVMVGDMAKDVEAGNAAGCWSVLISKDPGAGDRCGADHVAPDLGAAAEWITALDAPKNPNR